MEEENASGRLNWRYWWEIASQRMKMQDLQEVRAGDNELWVSGDSGN